MLKLCSGFFSARSLHGVHTTRCSIQSCDRFAVSVLLWRTNWNMQWSVGIQDLFTPGLYFFSIKQSKHYDNIFMKYGTAFNGSMNDILDENYAIFFWFMLQIWILVLVRITLLKGFIVYLSWNQKIMYTEPHCSLYKAEFRWVCLIPKQVYVWLNKSQISE